MCLVRFDLKKSHLELHLEVLESFNTSKFVGHI